MATSEEPLVISKEIDLNNLTDLDKKLLDIRILYFRKVLDESVNLLALGLS
ncbi:10565_t:CDS:2 [Racocetra fulgida]|uniref:10565_t:CDS:1 n=1 Tax=Racocetra fulgida TaxID=60492 RepID=A0A9N8ZFH1_9GLOM|nr:10565_t:CDS:2 [Racocetra fulgida]